MFEVMANDDQKRLWRALAKGTAPDWNQLFAGYASCIDWPSAYYWRDLIEFYPDARVILTYRSPESWWESFAKTILAGISQSTDQESLGLALISRQVFGGRPHDRAHAIAVYEAVNCDGAVESAAGPQSGRWMEAALPASWRASTGSVLSQSQQHEGLSDGSCTELVGPSAMGQVTTMFATTVRTGLGVASALDPQATHQFSTTTLRLMSDVKINPAASCSPAAASYRKSLCR
ncbi:hypothetical protein ABID19_002861 [Mesorhizobium robiniae]|uniref:Sulfotransferase family protein n=1 Tax=Mesorhizobium robiniae TaxID=559315 RepID=A0ABV2GNF4_9HYPH